MINGFSFVKLDKTGFGGERKMNCPICNHEMQEGGLITDGVAPGWVPLEQFNKKGVSRVIYT